MSLKIWQVVAVAGAILALTALLSACGGGEEEAAGTVVNVTMEETDQGWVYKLDRPEVPAGVVTFKVTNKGQFEHELMVYPPQRDMRHMLEEMKEAARMGKKAHAEIEGLIRSLDGEEELELEPGKSGTFTVNLSPGTYELGCLIVETVGGETFTHHEKGMHATITVR